MTDEGSKDCEVGYGRPPKATRFTPGKSGNPRGRPKGSRSVGAILKGVMSQKVRTSNVAFARSLTPRLWATNCRQSRKECIAEPMIKSQNGSKHIKRL